MPLSSLSNCSVSRVEDIYVKGNYEMGIASTGFPVIQVLQEIQDQRTVFR